MPFNFRRDLAIQLFALYLLFVGPVVMATLIFDRIASQRLETDVQTANLAVAHAIAEETNTTIQNSLQAVQQLATYPAVIAADPGEMAPIFETVLRARPDVNLIYRLDVHGIMVYHYPEGPGSTVGWDFSQRDYFQKALHMHSPLVSLGRISPTTQQAVATAVMPIWNTQGEFLGLVATNLRLESLSKSLASIASEHPSTEGFQIVMIDSESRVIASPDPASLLKVFEQGNFPVSQAVLGGQTGSQVLHDSSKIERLYTYVPIFSAGWGVIVSQPTLVAYQTPRTIHQGVLILIAVFLGIGFIFWWSLSRQVIHPLEELAVFSQTVGLEKGKNRASREAVKKITQRLDQIGHLSRSLLRMEQSVEARLRELSTLLKTSESVISTLDLRTVLERILEQVELLMKVDRCAIVAMDEGANVFRVIASRGLSQQYIDHLSIDPHDPQSVTMRALRTGKLVQVSDTEEDPTYTAFRYRSRSEGYRAILAVPLKMKLSRPAALLVYHPSPHVFDEREINLLSSFANHAAMAIENATLYEASDTRLKAQTQRLETLIQSMNDGLILEDLNGKVLYANRRACELTNPSFQEITGEQIGQVMDRLASRSTDPVKAKNAIRRALDSRGRADIEISLSIQGQVRVIKIQIFDVIDNESECIGQGQILQDITQSRELDRMKSSLIWTVSHELRTPLAAIKGYATTLLAEDVQWDPKAQREFLEIISQQTDELSGLVTNLLDMSRIEAGNLTLSKVDCRLEEMVQRAAQKALLSNRDRLQIELPSNLPTLHADPQRIEAVLRNLIENAAKYGQESPIRVCAEQQPEAVIVRVEDEGPGIPLEHRNYIFQSFYRVENGLSATQTGAGLGLAISQGFIRAHGGDIWLEPSEKGTCIAFSIPYGEATRK